MPLLNWLTREEDIRAADRVPYRLLQDVPDLGQGDGDEGLLVQGDNLEALKALLPFYAGRVKCIYIDPPYNTGSAFEHYDDSLEHAQWLSMIVPRLTLLREFLSEHGSIWVSIDDGDLFVADTDVIMERFDWSLTRHAAVLTEEELSFRRDENVIEIDLDGEKLVYSQTTQAHPVLRGLGVPEDAGIEASLVQWLERECRAPDVPQAEMTAWIAGIVADLLTRRDVSIRTLIDWQYQNATRIRAKISAIRDQERRTAHQIALFDEGAAPQISDAATIRFDDTVYANVPTHSTGAFRFKKHLLGPDRAPLIDGNPGGEEFQCAWSLDGIEEVAVWVRNVARHPDSFWLPKASGKFYPDFVARLSDGRLFVVEYKGSHLVGGPDEREKSLVGSLWARTSGNAYVTVESMKNGLDQAAQMRSAIAV